MEGGVLRRRRCRGVWGIGGLVIGGLGVGDGKAGGATGTGGFRCVLPCDDTREWVCPS